MAIDVTHTIDELLSLSVDDRLKVVEAVWDSIPEHAAISLLPEQQVELNRRLDEYEADPDRLLTWEKVLEGLRGQP